jgi:hypothetical protein
MRAATLLGRQGSMPLRFLFYLSKLFLGFQDIIKGKMDNGMRSCFDWHTTLKDF